MSGWERIANIGGGSFGIVEKWVHSRSGEAIALKIPKYLSSGMEKRWDDEIKQLGMLSHDNIVGTRKLPDDIQSHVSSRGPILCMEFCGGGSLRDQLRAPANRCGLSPRTALDVLRDVSSGVEYLHTQKIMHRDLKPENIVLQHRAGKSRSQVDCVDPDNSLPDVTFKLIDLGYAKNLRDTSMAASFVGTQVYLPPEMFIADCSYSYSAEYWSLGTLAFECITGKRPFFFNQHKVGIATWYDQLSKKEDKHIYGILESTGGEKVLAHFHSKLPDICCIREPYRHALEEWLRSVLHFSGKKRGGYRRSGPRSDCFDLLERILTKRVVHVFYAKTCTTYSYDVDELDNSMARLQETLAADADIPVPEQVLLSAIGQSVSAHSSISRSVQDLAYNNCWLFLMPTAEGFTLPQPRTVVHGLVHIVLREPTALLSHDKRKQAYEESIFLAHQMFRTSQRLMQSQRACILGVMRVSLRLEQQYKDCVDAANRLKFYLQFVLDSAREHLDHLNSVLAVLPVPLQQSARRLESELSNQLKTLSEWSDNDEDAPDEEEQQCALRDVRDRVKHLQRHEAVTLPQCDESFKLHVENAELLFKELQSEGNSGAAPTEAMSDLLNACSSDFKRISNSMFDHWYDMLVCHGICVNQLGRLANIRMPIAEKIKQLDKMRAVQMQVWDIVRALLVNAGSQQETHPGERLSRDAEPLPAPSTQAGQAPQQTGHSGTIPRSQGNFLNQPVIMESTSTSPSHIDVLRESQAAFDRFA
eukprot:scpid31117/ scgid30063/ Inhibitor of nuclear factor kappa-B kinase subunit alpha; Conserved helix-loop-helix ubiquitous kinase; Nuclear factor NF-kappa-B inhibitor kinase alpha